MDGVEGRRGEGVPCSTSFSHCESCLMHTGIGCDDDVAGWKRTTRLPMASVFHAALSTSTTWTTVTTATRSQSTPPALARFVHH